MLTQCVPYRSRGNQTGIDKRYFQWRIGPKPKLPEAVGQFACEDRVHRRISALLCGRESGNRDICTLSRRACQFYATSRGITFSTNCRNRKLRAPATNDTCDASAGPAAEVFAFLGPARRDRLLRPPATKIIHAKRPTRALSAFIKVASRKPAQLT